MEKIYRIIKFFSFLWKKWTWAYQDDFKRKPVISIKFHNPLKYRISIKTAWKLSNVKSKKIWKKIK